MPIRIVSPLYPPQQHIYTAQKKLCIFFLLQPSVHQLPRQFQKPIRFTEKELPLESTSSASPEQHWHCRPTIQKLVKCLTALLSASCQFNALTGDSNVPEYPESECDSGNFFSQKEKRNKNPSLLVRGAGLADMATLTQLSYRTYSVP